MTHSCSVAGWPAQRPGPRPRPRAGPPRRPLRLRPAAQLLLTQQEGPRNRPRAPSARRRWTTGARHHAVEEAGGEEWPLEAAPVDDPRTGRPLTVLRPAGRA